jgi:hypothetical protein
MKTKAFRTVMLRGAHWETVGNGSGIAGQTLITGLKRGVNEIASRVAAFALPKPHGFCLLVYTITRR